MLRFLLNVNNRFYVHLLFWAGYYFQRVVFYIDRYPNSPIVQFIEMMVKMPVVYINLYLLMPLLLKPKKNFGYGLSLLGLLLIGTTAMLQVILWMSQAGIYDLNYAPVFIPRRFINQMFHIINIVVVTTIIKVLKDAYQSQQINQELAQEKLETELKFLKAQINPHFLFNTLNNLYSLILLKSDKAGETVLKLSDLMSYMLHDTQYNQVSLEKEVQYLKDYIDLEKLRFGDELHLSFEVQGDLENVSISPMLLLPFVENVFKHSVADDETPIHIRLEGNYEYGYLYFEFENTVAAPSPEKSSKIKSSGIGLKNVRRRLELLYPKRHRLEIKSGEHTYLVILQIHLKTENHDKNSLPHH